ncbi:SPOR domain-containing protein [Shinella sp. CPCC 101442]|uniref:SPOR domain-containing protein n=1 Tax=Shinella sp. CPCC 101442 TaxID=2932265 RepID=UPI0021522743|nr:SPOR domain-containing protein [Shinella sp. CPCC 101442]MCR6501807.1 SPOR domain-containing protein [Shinella sp. CPCC 101442]
MADKNFARSGTADTDLLADDDPLSELARLVGYEPRPVKDVAKSYSEPLDTVPRRENPVLALEDELMRAFEQYDAPSRVAAEPVVAEKPVARPVEPVFEEFRPVAEDRAAVIDEIPTRDDAVTDVDPREPSFTEEVVEPVLEADPSLLLADELEAAVNEVPAVEVEPVVHTGRQFADRLEPHFEAPVRHEPVVDIVPSNHTASNERQPEFLGFQPMVADENPLDDLSLDLERELELSIGDGFADDLVADDRSVAEASFVEPQPVVVEVVENNAEPAFQEWMPAEADAEPFQAETAYAADEPHFVADLAFDSREERARAAAVVENQWQAEEPVFEAVSDYRVESVETAVHDRDALLADVERYPVPEARTPFAGESRNPANIASIFSRRATPTVHHREPVLSKVTTPVVEPVKEPVARIEPAPVVETRSEPVVAPAAVAAAEPEIDFESMEFDLSDIELDLSDIVLDDLPVKADAKPVEVKPVAMTATVAKPAEAQAPVRREPAVAVPVSTYTATPQPVVAEMADGSLPFDPSMIADTDVGVSPVTELDVPQLPVIEKEKPPVAQPDYEFDIDAEMAQLFTEPAAKPARGESLQAGVAAGAVAAATVAQPAAQMNDVDDFERALEEDFRRSLSQPERMAIPVDPGQATQLYSGDGYDDEQSRPRRGLLIAASIAGLLLIGGGGVYAWSAFTGGTAASGEPRVILADKAPIKVVPEEKGGKTVPNQDKAVYDRVAGDNANTPQQEQLVTSTEEPIDVVQRTLTPETLPDDGIDTPATAEDDSNRLLPGVDEPETGTADGKPLVSPRKVKTMIVKPDGTLVAREDIVSEPAAETAGLDAKATATTAATSGEASATANATLDADASLRAEQIATDGQPRSALAEVATAEVDDTAPVRTVKTTTIGATTGTTTDGKAPVPVTRPVDQPVTVVGTVTENGNVAGTQTASATQTQQTAEQTQVAAVAPGSYVVQIASVPSEAEAQKTYKTLSSKFGSVIGGRGVDIKKAEIPNKGTFFRIRIPAGSREEANALCSRYKGAGGSCLVTR